MPSSSKRSSKGRQKIQMKKMTNESNLQVTFSKRRSGLFKKASELCTLCGVQVALIVFSPGDKVFSFGHPNVETVINRFVAGTPQPLTSEPAFIEAHRAAKVRDLNAKLTELNEELEAGRKKAEDMNRLRKEAQARWWWAAPFDEMSVPQLQQFKMALEELKKSIVCHSDKVQAQQGAGGIGIDHDSTDEATHQFHAGTSSSSYYVPQMWFQNTLQQNENQFDGNNLMTNQMCYGGYTSLLLGGGGGGYGTYGNNGFF